MAVGVVPAHAYQASDMQRNYRKIIQDGRSGRALIRDKDGVMLTLAPTEMYERSDRLVDYLMGHIHLTYALEVPRSSRHVTALGQMAWAAPLDDNDLRTFASELADTLLIAAAGGSLAVVEELVHDWQITAQVAADPELSAELLADIDEPPIDELLTDVEL